MDEKAPKFTPSPAPWSIDPKRARVNVSGDAELIDASGEFLACVAGRDAALIAAAPDLYAACELLLAYVGDRSAGSGEAWDAAVAALEKARGEA
jgi:hypothetical protein